MLVSISFYPVPFVIGLLLSASISFFVLYNGGVAVRLEISFFYLSISHVCYTYKICNIVYVQGEPRYGYKGESDRLRDR